MFTNATVLELYAIARRIEAEQAWAARPFAGALTAPGALSLPFRRSIVSIHNLIRAGGPSTIAVPVEQPLSHGSRG